MKKLLYMVVDTETATLPFSDDIACGDANVKKAIAIAKPLIYDIGWTICDRAGTIYEKKQFLISETFSVPSVFNTAYYAEKRPIYIDLLSKSETNILPWNEVMKIFVSDLEKVHAVGAFNSMFDFKKAIPFTELYISKLYSNDYYAWERYQKDVCIMIANGTYNFKNENFDNEVFSFRGVEYALFDIWGLATTHLLNTVNYKRDCINKNAFTASGVYFKTSAEQCYRYLCNKYDFIESHTALDDAIIETFILSKIAQRHAVTIGIKYFPFRDLGTTDEFCKRNKKPNIEECKKVYEAISAYIEAQETLTRYATSLVKKLQELAEYAGFESAF